MHHKYRINKFSSIFSQIPSRNLYLSSLFPSLAPSPRVSHLCTVVGGKDYDTNSKHLLLYLYRSICFVFPVSTGHRLILWCVRVLSLFFSRVVSFVFRCIFHLQIRFFQWRCCLIHNDICGNSALTLHDIFGGTTRGGMLDL